MNGEKWITVAQSSGGRRTKVNYRLLSQVLLASVVGWIVGEAYAYSVFLFLFHAWRMGITDWLPESSPWPWPILGAIVFGLLRLAWWRS